MSYGVGTNGAEDLSGKVALVTGGSRGIGAAICAALASAGCQVAFVYLNDEAAANATISRLAEYGGRPLAIRADLRNADAIQALIERVRLELGDVEILVSNGGRMTPARLEQVDDELWQNTMNEQVRAALLLTQATVQAMQKAEYGRIIYMSSISAQTGGVLGPHYAAAKAALAGLMHWVAANYARDGITANAIAPSLIETGPRSNDLMNGIPVGRFGQPEEVARITLALIATGYVTGQTLLIDGGQRTS